MRDYTKAQEIIKTEVVNYQKSSGNEVYLDKHQYWYYVGAITYCDNFNYNDILNDLRADISHLVPKEKYTYKRQYPINS